MAPGTRTATTLCVLLLAAGTGRARAAQPFGTDDAGTVAPEHFELETGGHFGDGHARSEVGFTHGVGRCMDLSLSTGYTRLPRGERGFDSATVGLKFGLVPGVLSTTFAAAFGDPAYQVTAVLTRCSGPLHVHANLGCLAVGARDSAALVHALAAVWTRPRVNLGIEVLGTGPDLDGAQVGGGWSPVEPVMVYAGLGADLDADMEPVARVGVWYCFTATPAGE
ncbi:MAG: hypothetical protein AB1505_36980 [Candidatus Latescibacterota bacterium]